MSWRVRSDGLNAARPVKSAFRRSIREFVAPRAVHFDPLRGAQQGTFILEHSDLTDFAARALSSPAAADLFAALAAFMTIDFDSGKQLEGGAYPESSWSVNEATAVWDAVLNSVRLRPGAV